MLNINCKLNLPFDGHHGMSLDSIATQLLVPFLEEAKEENNESNKPDIRAGEINMAPANNPNNIYQQDKINPELPHGCYGILNASGEIIAKECCSECPFYL